MAVVYASLLAVTVMVWAPRAMTRGSTRRVISSPAAWLAVTVSAPSSRTAKAMPLSVPAGVRPRVIGPRSKGWACSPWPDAGPVRVTAPVLTGSVPLSM